MNRKLLLALLGGLLGAGLMSTGAVVTTSAAEDRCYVRAADGTCLDDYTIPTTGQYTAADDHLGETPVPAGVDRFRQPHGVVRLRESTYIDAHDICRFVDNSSSRGPGLFIGLRTRNEWKAVAIDGKEPAGTTIISCCRAVTVQVCGASRTIPYSKIGNAVTITGGYNRAVTYTCASGTAGAVPTFDTSWLVGTQGQCSAPTTPPSRCPEGYRWDGGKDSTHSCVPLGGNGGDGGHGGGNDGPDGPAHDGDNGNGGGPGSGGF